MRGRERDAALILEANKASAVGRLMLGQFRNWQGFLETDTLSLSELPRKRLKSGKHDVQKRLSQEIDSFCRKNFHGMTKKVLASLYDEIKSFRGLEMPLQDFENKFAKIRPEVLKGDPCHLTVVISLWGMSFKFPEFYLAKDVIQAIRIAEEAENKIAVFRTKKHEEISGDRKGIAKLEQERVFGSRMAVLCCVNLVEAYLNGIAWDFSQNESKLMELSKKKQELMKDGTTRKKLLNYPEIVTQKRLWDERDETVQAFLELTKVFRDSLVHPSPFTTPDKFGGHDKLSYLYRLDFDVACASVEITVRLIGRMIAHIAGAEEPSWYQELKEVTERLDYTKTF